MLQGAWEGEATLPPTLGVWVRGGGFAGCAAASQTPIAFALFLWNLLPPPRPEQKLQEGSLPLLVSGRSLASE